MIFRDLKPSYPVYILDKETVTATEGKVVSVSNPRFPSPQPPLGTTNNYMQVVDVTIEYGGKQTTYTIPENLELTYAGNGLVISTQRDSIIAEVRTLKRINEEELAKTDIRRKTIDLCATILEDYDPSLRERRENDARFANLESGLADMKSMMQTLIQKLE